MKHCCENKSQELEKIRIKQGHVLKIVLVINATMFLIEFAGGWLSNSSAVLADSLDMLGDAIVYGFSLYVLNKGMMWRARAGLLKGLTMIAFGLSVAAELLHKLFSQTIPLVPSMSIIGFLALIANLICLYLLYAHKEDDINMRSTWICSRNDIIANLGVLFASLLVAKTQSFWPDLLVGGIIAILFLSSAFNIIKDSIHQLRTS